MARPPKGKPLTLRPIRLDDDVWAECQRLGKEFGTINEGLRVVVLKEVKVTNLVTNDSFRGAKLTPDKTREALKRGPIFDDIDEFKPRERQFKGPLLKPSERGNKKS